MPKNNFSDIKVPFLNEQKIKTKTELFRKKFWNDSVPVDIEKIIDVKLKIDVIPIQGLQRLTDALISSNWQSIYVDYDKYINDDNQNRLRFSLAHEIGHFVLHKDIYNSFNIKSLEDFYQFIEQVPNEQYSYLETQANKFAGYLLVPRDKLAVEKQKVLKKVQRSYDLDLKKIEVSTLNSYLAMPISNIFGVSPEVIEITLNQLDD